MRVHYRMIHSQIVMHLKKEDIEDYFYLFKIPFNSSVLSLLKAQALITVSSRYPWPVSNTTNSGLWETVNDDKFKKDPAPIVTECKWGKLEIETLPVRLTAKYFPVSINSRLGRSNTLIHYYKQYSSIQIFLYPSYTLFLYLLFLIVSIHLKQMNLH